MSTRPLADDSGYTCDWGGCDAVAVAERSSPQHGWLPVCQRHRGPAPRGRASVRAKCPNCGRTYALTNDGRLPLHRNGWVTCPASRKPAVRKDGS